MTSFAAAGVSSDRGLAPAFPLTRRQKQLVRESFATLSPASDLLAEAFYRRLFEIAPQVRPMFTDSEAEQRRKLITALRLAVAGLDRIGEIAPTLRLLGVRHRDYGVAPLHYGYVAEALLWTLSNCLGDRFDSETRDAWVAVYTLMAEIMTAEG
ncbi:MAG: globin family protein [Pseudomonadota bacterium]|nr:globin family protein [Pseudomonadota bacterium]